MTKSLLFRIAAFAALFCLTLIGRAELSRTSLDGEWLFALDPVDAGMQQEWFKPGMATDKWDKVAVPHCFSVDPRYHYFTGTTWYLKTFHHAAQRGGVRNFVRFEAVFYRARVWLNGKYLGEHEGGYTPFEFDVTDVLENDNLLAVQVNNAWGTDTLPGAKTKVDYQSLNYGQLYPWMNYGGITRATALITRPEIYLERVKIEATPDLGAQTARLNIRAFVQNRSAQPWNGNELGAAIFGEGKKLRSQIKVAGESIAAHSAGEIRIDATLAQEDVRLWSFDNPVLYEAELTAGSDVVRTTFGIRSVEVRGTKLLLNGEPISLGGCNRPMDAPGYGSIDPTAVLERDLRLMKSGGLELSRIIHYPVSTQLLDWADRHGLLIVTEAGNWQMTPAQMSDPKLRAKFQSQMTEMIERDWNHPSVIAWSVGNEYQSQTEEGRQWTKDMYAFAKSLDSTRLITFASNIAARKTIERPEDEASQFVDFVSANIYGHHREALQHIHALYPNKPVLVSEFGQRADAVADERERVAYMRQAAADFRACSDFLIGASVWTFNDYESLFPGTNANGYRPWGLVAPDRTPREMYYAAQKEFSPATVEVRTTASGQRQITITARADFPSYVLRGYQIQVEGRTFDLPVLAPGQSTTLTITSGADHSSSGTVKLLKPGGFVILETTP